MHDTVSFPNPGNSLKYTAFAIQIQRILRVLLRGLKEPNNSG